MLTRLCAPIALVAAAIGCRGRDPGFDITRVPESAYASRDGGRSDAESDAAADARASIVMCIPEVDSSDDSKESQEMAEGFEKCPQKYEGRTFDPHATERHRKKDGESEVCCYRRGRVAPPTPGHHDEDGD